MSRTILRYGIVGTGVLVVLLGVVVALVVGPRPTDGQSAVGVLVVLVGAVVALVKIAWSGGDASTTPPPWTDAGAIVETPPEAGPADERVSGTALSVVVERAGERARSAGSVEDGLAEVRPVLRDTLSDALTRGGRDQDAVEQALADGSWTDDAVAAAALDEAVTPPERTLRRRLWAWLFPERAVRARTARTVAAVAEAADESLPPVVGQDAPRPVPVVTPTLDDLRRTADGRLQRAEAIGAGDGPGPDAGETSASAVDHSTSDSPSSDPAGSSRRRERGDDDSAETWSEDGGDDRRDGHDRDDRDDRRDGNHGGGGGHGGGGDHGRDGDHGNDEHDGDDRGDDEWADVGAEVSD